MAPGSNLTNAYLPTPNPQKSPINPLSNSQNNYPHAQTEEERIAAIQSLQKQNELYVRLQQDKQQLQQQQQFEEQKRMQLINHQQQQSLLDQQAQEYQKQQQTLYATAYPENNQNDGSRIGEKEKDNNGEGELIKGRYTSPDNTSTSSSSSTAPSLNLETDFNNDDDDAPPYESHYEYEKSPNRASVGTGTSDITRNNCGSDGGGVSSNPMDILAARFAALQNKK